MKKRLLYYCPSVIGGVARNGIEQAVALANAGVEIEFLTTREFDLSTTQEGIRFNNSLVPTPRSGQYSRSLSRCLLACSILRNHRIFLRSINEGRYCHAMLATYSEYLGPLWAKPLRKLHDRGVVFGANVLDPIRNYVVGPKCWHDKSVVAGYSYLNHAFVYTTIDLAEFACNPKLITTVIPHGPYDYPKTLVSRADVRSQLGVPDNAYLFLSFGHIRDNKNLDLVLEALKSVPEAHLFVAGSQAPPGQKPAQYYQELAAKFGVDKRVYWKVGYLPDSEVAEVFSAADSLLMTYSESFLSTSGVLYTAAPLRMPMIVSAGDSALVQLVEQYGLGWRVGPDSVSEITRGMKIMLAGKPESRWDDFFREQSYDRAAKIIIDKMFS